MMILRVCNKFMNKAFLKLSYPIVIVPSCRMLSDTTSTSKQGKKRKSDNLKTANKPQKLDIPRDFFDENVEDDKEFLDIAIALESAGGLENLTTVKDSMSWQGVDDNTYSPSTFTQDLRKTMDATNVTMAMDDSGDDDDELTPSESLVTNALCTTDLGEQLDKLPAAGFIPPEVLNYTVPWRMSEEFSEPMLENFVPNTSPEKFRYDKQGSRACPGGLQRRGKKGDLGCHLIDLDDFHYLDVLSVRRFLSDDSEILNRKLTGLCSKCQRKVASTIKRARNLGLVPHLGEFTLQDSRPLQSEFNFHDPIHNGAVVESKTII